MIAMSAQGFLDFFSLSAAGPYEPEKQTLKWFIVVFEKIGQHKKHP